MSCKQPTLHREAAEVPTKVEEKKQELTTASKVLPLRREIEEEVKVPLGGN